RCDGHYPRAGIARHAFHRCDGARSSDTGEFHPECGTNPGSVLPAFITLPDFRSWVDGHGGSSLACRQAHDPDAGEIATSPGLLCDLPFPLHTDLPRCYGALPRKCLTRTPAPRKAWIPARV